MHGLSELFGPEGALARRLPGYTYRAAQQEMAELVAAALEQGEHLAVEAGTGIGKTFAYLVPALASGRRVIVSTGTRTLQDQLFARDLPLLGGLMGRPARVALLKGRNNYLCLHRLETARSSGPRDAETWGALEALRVFAGSSPSGDLTELEDLQEDHALRAAVTSTVDNCLGSRCELYERCFVLEARRRAQRAEIVIVNHHLLLADLALKEAGFGELLPGADAVIVDEAHLFPDIAQQFFGVSVTTRELEQLVRDVRAEARLAGLDGELERELQPLADAVADARIGEDAQPPGRIPWPAARRFGAALPAWQAELQRLAGTLSEVADAGPGLARCRDRCLDGAARLEHIAEAEPESGLRWLERSPYALAAHWTPLDVGEPLAARIEGQGGAWVFASATLAVRGDFDHFLRRVGLPKAATRVLPSPFDYRRNARLYLPQGLPDPGRDDYTESLLHCAWPLIEAAGGGAFLLFTSYRALRAAQDFVALRSAPGPVYVQGNGPRSLLLARFREAGNALLLGTGSFWQGVDVRGPALRLVLIDKLPFAAPSDPMVQARVNAIRRRGGDAFTEAQLPQAVLALKQGAGRLIRDFDDRGLIVLGDPRIRTRPYGRVFLESLPAMPVVDELDEALAYARRLAPGAAPGLSEEAENLLETT
jgi:ATP-dependent DNA helicase DinG